MRMMTDELASLARKTAVGMAAQVAAGHTEEADMLLSMYLREANAEGMVPPMALMAMVKTLTSMAVAVLGDEAYERFSDLASSMTVVEP